MAAGVFTPYSTISPFIRGMPTWVPEDEQERIASYQTYEEIYWNHSDSFELIRRGAEDKPVYIPNPMTIVDTTSHFILKDLSVGFVEGNAEAVAALRSFIDRERFFAKFHTAKQSGVVRGDFVLHITADPEKPEGSRISFNSVDPASYFPVYDDDDLDRIIKVHLVEQFMEDDEVKVKKLTYSKDTEGGSQRITRVEAVYALDEWSEPGATPERVIHDEAQLPEEVTAIPVYHFKNKDWQGQPFGSSELRGFERLLGAINQTVSDEELALALEGLGVYATDAPEPTNEEGDKVPWEIAPARVIKHPEGKKFYRVEGIKSVVPTLDHIKYLEEKLFEASGTTEVARGTVDVRAAESGIALAIKFTPTLAKIEQRDESGQATLKQLFYDWKAWHKAYEGPDFRELLIDTRIGPKLPTNRDSARNELNDMLDKKVISRAYYREQMTLLFDYQFPEDIDQQIISEESRLLEAMDMVGARINGELDNSGEEDENETPDESG